MTVAISTSLSVQVLFDQPQREIASKISNKLVKAKAVWILVGFATDGGLASILPAIAAAPKKLQQFILGAGTYRGYEAMEQLIALGIPEGRLLVHLGHTRDHGTNGFVRYHPMMHSKIFLIELEDGSVSAFVGSHNLTSFAMSGHNGEAGVLIEGPAHHPEIVKLKMHVAEAAAQAIPYKPEMKDALAWWTTQYFDGLRREINIADEAESVKTFVIIATATSQSRPKNNDVIYFEIPAGLPNITSLKSEVHIFIFDTLPASPTIALNQLHLASYALSCKTRGLELKKGGVELQANWEISDSRAPQLCATRRPFRPRPAPDMQQVRVAVMRPLTERFSYLFDAKPRWKPIYDYDCRLNSAGNEESPLKESDQMEFAWFLVRGLERMGPSGRKKYLDAIKEVSPETGNYILLSSMRMNLDASAETGELEELEDGGSEG